MATPLKKLESKSAGQARRKAKFAAAQKEATVAQAAILPRAPDYFSDDMAREYSQQLQLLADASLLIPSRLSLLEQWCVLRARARADGVENLSTGLHAQLKAVTLELWKPGQSMQAKEHNAFIDL